MTLFYSEFGLWLKNEGIRATWLEFYGGSLYAVSAFPKFLPGFKFPAFYSQMNFGTRYWWASDTAIRDRRQST